jgi:hypothetical protein
MTLVPWLLLALQRAHDTASTHTTGRAFGWFGTTLVAVALPLAVIVLVWIILRRSRRR